MIHHTFSHLHSALPLFTSLTLPRNSSLFRSLLIFSDISRLADYCDLPGFGAGFDSVYTELCSSEFHRPFIFSSTHILIYIYHLLRTLLMPPFFSHSAAVHPSFPFASLLTLFSTSAFHHPLFCRARAFYMLAVSLFLFPIPRLYRLLQLQLLLSLFLLLSLLPFSPVNLVL